MEIVSFLLFVTLVVMEIILQHLVLVLVQLGPMLILILAIASLYALTVGMGKIISVFKTAQVLNQHQILLNYANLFVPMELILIIMFA